MEEEIELEKRIKDAAEHFDVVKVEISEIEALECGGLSYCYDTTKQGSFVFNETGNIVGVERKRIVDRLNCTGCSNDGYQGYFSCKYCSKLENRYVEETYLLVEKKAYELAKRKSKVVSSVR